MAGITIPGVSNKYGTNETVSKLMEVERIPLVREQQTLDGYKKQQDAWRELNKKTTSLRDSVKTLYSFDNPFNNKVAESSQDTAITAIATRNAVYEDFNMEVIERAQADRYLTSQLDKSTKVPIGTYTYKVSDKSITLKWKGGNLTEFSKALTKRGRDTLRSRVITVSKDKVSLTIESLITGSANRLQFVGDARTFAISTEMISEGGSQGGDASDTQDDEVATNEPGDFGQNGNASIGGVTIDNEPFDMGDGSAGESFNVAGLDEEEDYGEDPDAVDVDYTPLHPISIAKNAILKYEGITVRRPSNEVDDLVPEVTLSLLNKTDGPAKITIKPDTESAKDALITFVGKYNQAIAQMNILSQNKSELIDEIDYLSDSEKEEQREKLGLFLSDSSITGLKGALQAITQGNYIFSDKATVTMLNQLGIATNASNGGSYTPSKLRGYLEIDEKKLDEELAKHLDDVKSLFGFDGDGDLITDDGIAYKIDKQLTSYVQIGGIFALKTSGLDTKIKSSQERITKLESQMEKKEAELKYRYSQMEGALNSLEAQQTRIQNFSNRGNKE